MPRKLKTGTPVVRVENAYVAEPYIVRAVYKPDRVKVRRNSTDNTFLLAESEIAIASEFYPDDRATSAGDLLRVHQRKFHRSTRKWSYQVMDLSNGDLKWVDKDDLTEVLPYTVEVKNMLGNPAVTFAAVEGSVKKGDLLLIDDADVPTHAPSPMWVVTKLDTKSRKSNLRPLKARKLTTKAVKELD